MKKILQINTKLSDITMAQIESMRLTEDWSTADMIKTAILTFPETPDPISLADLKSIPATNRLSLYLSDSLTMQRYQAICQTWSGLTHSERIGMLIENLAKRLGVHSGS